MQAVPGRPSVIAGSFEPSAPGTSARIHALGTICGPGWASSATGTAARPQTQSTRCGLVDDTRRAPYAVGLCRHLSTRWQSGLDRQSTRIIDRLSELAGGRLAGRSLLFRNAWRTRAPHPKRPELGGAYGTLYEKRAAPDHLPGIDCHGGSGI